ncbi:MAG: hypothetical protein PHY02_09695 [Phycisphaerae bacterium]|nr:hypothetical protein [Phycisphaerae bacterium]
MSYGDPRNNMPPTDSEMRDVIFGTTAEPEKPNFRLREFGKKEIKND